MNQNHVTIVVWASVIIVAIVVITFCWKFLVSSEPFKLKEIGTTDILAFGVSMFAIWLSVSFYHKANESANLFYDNTYQFTKDVSVILGRIESGFGERLSQIDSGVKSMLNPNTREFIKDRLDVSSPAGIEKAKLVQTLADSSSLTESERQELLKRIHEKEVEIKNNEETILMLIEELDQRDFGAVSRPPQVQGLLMSSNLWATSGPSEMERNARLSTEMQAVVDRAYSFIKNVSEGDADADRFKMSTLLEKNLTSSELEKLRQVGLMDKEDGVTMLGHYFFRNGR